MIILTLTDVTNVINPIVAALSSKNGLFNPYFWPLRSCECEESFRHCLAAVSSETGSSPEQRKSAEEFTADYFGELQPRCFTVRKATKCVDYDLWHTKCLSEEEQDVFVFS